MCVWVGVCGIKLRYFLYVYLYLGANRKWEVGDKSEELLLLGSDKATDASEEKTKVVWFIYQFTVRYRFTFRFLFVSSHLKNGTWRIFELRLYFGPAETFT